MLPIAYYLLKVIICSGILYGYYWLLLRNKVFHKYNRFYLMASVVLSLLLPLIKISFWQQNTAQQSSVIKMLQAVSNGDEYMDTVVISSQNNAFDATQLLPFAYLMVSLILLAVFFHTLYVIARLLKKYPQQTIESISFINTDAKSTPFSFLKYIFWNHNIDLETTTGNQIFKHELAHVQEGHTYDKLFINLVLIFFWCNPFFWLYRKELNMIHEFIADKKAVEDSDTAAFAAMILQATYPQHRFQLTNNFFYSPVKRRLLMLTKNKNPKVNYLGRIMVLPLLVLVFAAFTFKTKTVMEAGASMYNGKKIVVVIDPAHGGNDVGAKGIDGILEKDMALSIAKKIKALNNNNAIEIILTRESDIYMDVRQKIDFANNHKADLFISIHLDATAKDSFNTKTGMSVWVAKNNSSGNLLAAALVDAFTKNYSLDVATAPMQRQTGIRVLEGSNCPAVLIEPGFITNAKDAEYLQTATGKETIAKNILTAISNFATANLHSNTVASMLDETAVSSNSFYVNTAHADSNYLKSNDFKNKALIILDSKEIGNYGIHYVEQNNIKFTSMVTYNPVEANIRYGDKGRYGVIKLSVNDAICMTADSFSINEKNNSLSLSGDKTNVTGGLENALIYVDGKISTPLQLHAIQGDKISSVNILKGESLADMPDAKGKTSVINITLKPEPLAVVVVEGRAKPLYVVNNIVKEKEFNINSIQPNNIESINVLKNWTAAAMYGDKGKNGVVEITLKKEQPVLQEIVVEGRQIKPLYVINDKVQDDDVIFKSLNPDAIERINVLKDTTAVAKYGEKGKNGVVEIFTKKNIAITLKNPLQLTEVRGQNVNDKVFTKVEVESYYAAGNDAWKKYLQHNLNPSIPVAEGWKAGTYTIIVQFIIHTDGTVSDVTTTNYQGTKTALHCIDIIKQSGKWLPAVQNGHVVNAYRKQPITFLITNEDVKKPITKIYSVPLKVHLFEAGKVNTYNMAGNGTFTSAINQLYYVNGKISSNPGTIKKENVSSMESYDAGAGKLYFGDKGKYGVTLITTKS